MSRASVEAAVANEAFFNGWNGEWVSYGSQPSTFDVLHMQGPVFDDKQHRLGVSIVDIGDSQVRVEGAVENVKGFLATHEHREAWRLQHEAQGHKTDRIEARS